MSLNTYPYNPFPASTDKLDEAHNADLQQEVDQLKSGLTNYEKQNNLNLEVPNRKNVLPITLAGIKAANPIVTWTDNVCAINGVTYTIQTDSDGKVTGITASGTANSNADLYLYSNMDSFLSKCAGMIFNGVTDGSMSTYGIGLYNKGIQVTTGDVTITTDLATAPSVYIRVNNGITVNDIVFTPMIRPATITDPTFAPYIPSVDSRIEAVENLIKSKAFHFVEADIDDNCLITDIPTTNCVIGLIVTNRYGWSLIAKCGASGNISPFYWIISSVSAPLSGDFDITVYYI